MILTYLPANIRIECQAYGRASRAGDKGTGRMIINSPSNDHISLQKQTRDQNDLVRLENISAYYNNFILVKENFFKEFRNAYRRYNEALEKGLHALLFESSADTYQVDFSAVTNNDSSLIRTILLDNFKIQWAFWLDESAIILEKWENIKNKEIVVNSFDKFLSKFDTIEYKNIDLHPVLRLKLFKWFATNKRFVEANSILKEDFQHDSIVFNYYSICIDLIINQKVNGYKQRDLFESKEMSLKLCLDKFNDRQNFRSAQNFTINALKMKHRSTIISIDAFIKQQNSINNFEGLFTNNIRELLGKTVCPETFHSPFFSNDLAKHQIYNAIVKNNLLFNPKISRVKIDKNVEKIANKYQIFPQELENFIENNRQFSFESIHALSEKLRSQINFPSREKFWEELFKLQILTNEVQFAVINITLLRNIDPSEADKLLKNLEYEKLKMLPVDKITNIYMDNVNDDNEAIKNKNVAIAVSLKILEDELHKLKLKKFRELGCIKIHTRGNFEIETYEQLKVNKMFFNFDEINDDDFKSLVDNPEDILKSLRKQKILTENNQFDYGNSNDLKLGEDFVYEEQISKLLSKKFAFRIALEVLALKIYQNIENKSLVKNEIIHLHTHPHVLIVQDLIENCIVDAEKVNPKVLKQIKNLPIFKKSLLAIEIKSLLIYGGISCDHELFKALLKCGLIKNVSDRKSEKESDESDETDEKMSEKRDKRDDNDESNDEPELPDIPNESESPKLYEVEKIIEFNPNSILRGNSKLERNSFYFIDKIDMNTKSLPEKYSNIELTIKLLLQNRKAIIESKTHVSDKVNECKLLMGLTDNSEFVFKPIDDMKAENDTETLNFMKLKGFDLILRVQEKKRHSMFYVLLAAAFIAGFLQIVIGLLISSTYFLTGFGKMLIEEGIKDIVFGRNSFNSGRCDYKQFKIVSIMRIVQRLGFNIAKSKEEVISFSSNLDKKSGKNGWSILREKISKKQQEQRNSVTQGAEINSIKTISTAHATMENGKLIEQQLSVVNTKIASWIDNQIKAEIQKQEIPNLIDELLQLHSTDECEKIVDAKFKNILNNTAFTKQMTTAISHKVNQVIKSGDAVNKILKTFNTVDGRTVALSPIDYFLCKVLKELQFELKNVIATSPDHDELLTQKLTSMECSLPRMKVCDEIQQELSEHIKTVVDDNIISPALKYAADFAFSRAENAAIDAFTSLALSKTENNFSLNEIELELSKLNKNENASNNYSHYVDCKVMEILKNTTSPFVFTQLNTIDTPITHIDVECAAILIKSKLNKGIKIVIDHEGILYSFGEGADVVEIDLKNFHFLNAKFSFNIECLFNALCEKLPGLKIFFNINSFKDEAKKLIGSDAMVKEFIGNLHNKHFLDMNFDGTIQSSLISRSQNENGTENFECKTGGSYNELYSVYKKAAKIYFLPSKNAYKKTIFEKIKQVDMPAIALICIDSKLLPTINNSNNASNEEDFSKILKNNIIELHNALVESKFCECSNAHFKAIYECIDYCCENNFSIKGNEKPLLTAKECEDLKEFVRKLNDKEIYCDYEYSF